MTMTERQKGTFRRIGYCGNTSPITGECIIGCDPGWCEKHPATLAREAEDLKAAIRTDGEQAPEGK